MRIHFAVVPVFDSAAAEQELNTFLASHRVLKIERSLVDSGAGAAWAVSVTYLLASTAAAPVKKGKLDYREILPEPEFAVYAKLRGLRKTLAERDAVPAYALFTNEQLAAIVQQRVQSPAALAAIAGVGKARVDKYGAAFLAVMQKADLGPSPPPAAAAQDSPDGAAKPSQPA